MSDEVQFGEDSIYFDCTTPVTITLPQPIAGNFKVQFPNFDPSLHVLKVDRLPDWFGAGDLIINRRGRTFARSLTQTEPRWRQWWRRIKARFER